MSHTHLATLTAGKYFTYYVSVSFSTFGVEPKLPFFLGFVTKSCVLYLQIRSEKRDISFSDRQSSWKSIGILTTQLSSQRKEKDVHKAKRSNFRVNGFLI